MKLNTIHNLDCLKGMSRMKSASVDMVLSDLPYGITANKWDSVIPLDQLWAAFKHVLTPNGVIVLTASQPFTSILVMSQLSMFRHEWVWLKNRGSNFLNTVREPFKEHESVLVFGGGKWTYNGQQQRRVESGNSRIGYTITQGNASTNYRSFDKRTLPPNHRSVLRVPSSYQKFNTEVGLHPTQKPVALFEYLVRTYTNEGNVVLDCCMGSGTTAIACRNSGRQYIGFETSKKYFGAAQERIRAHVPRPTTFMLDDDGAVTSIKKRTKVPVGWRL